MSEISSKFRTYKNSTGKLKVAKKYRVQWKGIAFVEQLTPTFKGVPSKTLQNGVWMDVNTYNNFKFFELNYTNYNTLLKI